MLFHRFMADAVLFTHAGFVGFVVLGQLLVLIGLVKRWSWVRNLWFRAAHLAAILIVVSEAWTGMPCPLTTLESYLREQGGGVGYPGDFIAYWVGRFLFYEAERWVFVLCYSIFGAVVLATWVWGPPRRPRRGLTSLRQTDG